MQSEKIQGVNKYCVSVVFIFLLFGSRLTAQGFQAPIGTPPIHNYLPDEYHNAGKIWQIAPAPNGKLYMATDRGLLSFDGVNWKLFRGSEGHTRSVHIISDSLIYTGSDLDFGVWTLQKTNTWHYKSLYNFKKELQSLNEEFWHVHEVGDKIIFVSFYNIYLLKNEQIVKIKAPGKWSGSFVLDGTLYLADADQGLYQLDGLELKKLCSAPIGSRFELVGMYAQGNSIKLATRYQGLLELQGYTLVPIDNDLSSILKSGKLFSFSAHGDYLVFGTVQKGILITDTSGRILHKINKTKGLTNNTILSLSLAPNGLLWAGQDIGLSTIDLSSTSRYILDANGDIGSGSTALLHKENFYLGTNQGLFQSKWSDLEDWRPGFDFGRISGSDGQVWDIQSVGNKILVGHDQGLFEINDKKLSPIRTGIGTFTIAYQKPYLWAGTYNGLSIYKQEGDRFQYLKNMDSIVGGCTKIVFEAANVVWVHIPNFGFVRTQFNEKLIPTERSIFLEKDLEGLDFELLLIKGKIQLQSDQRTYLFDSASKKFRPTSKKEGYTLSPLQEKVLDSLYSFFPTYNGFGLRVRYQGKSFGPNQQLTLVKVTAYTNDAEMDISPSMEIPYPFEHLKILALVPNQSNVLYSYRLHNTDQWSAWTSSPLINLIELPSGSQKLEIRAKINEQITQTLVYKFYITPPWYFRWYAFPLYAILALVIYWAIKKRQRQLLEVQKIKLLEEQQQKIEAQKIEHANQLQIIEQNNLRQEHEQLKQQLKRKTIELANKAKEDEEKNRFILSIKEKLEEGKSNPFESKKKWNEIQLLLDNYLKVDDPTFEIQMDELHQDFFRRLKEKYPSLSSNDLRLCAYIKIGLNSKEIAEIMSILPSSIFISRSRIRKKMALNESEDLFEILNQL